MKLVCVDSASPRRDESEGPIGSRVWFEVGKGNTSLDSSCGIDWIAPCSSSVWCVATSVAEGVQITENYTITRSLSLPDTLRSKQSSGSKA